MKLERIAFAVLLAAATGIAAAPARAQVATSKPITVKIKTVKPRKPKLLTFKGEVLHMDAQAIIVRNPKDNLTVKTFSYTPELSKKLKELIDRGGYQYGDRVQVKYAGDGTVAQEITGKASKPH